MSTVGEGVPRLPRSGTALLAAKHRSGKVRYAMTSSPYFSVVLTTYGRGEHIRPTIESVLRQTYSDFELIVVGDGCTDETEEVVRSFGSRPVSWYNLEQNSGSQSFPNNLGIKNAAGKWIAYLGHDDIWSPNHLAALRALTQSACDLDFAVRLHFLRSQRQRNIFHHGVIRFRPSSVRAFFSSILASAQARGRRCDRVVA